MTAFAPAEIVRCPSCGQLVRRLRFASIHFSDGLFPPAFQKLARGEVVCPRCGEGVKAHELAAIARLDAPWKKGIWAGVPELWPAGEAGGLDDTG